MAGLGDRLRARKPPTETVRLPHDPAQYAQAERDLEAARWALEDARSRGYQDLSALRERVEVAQAALDGSACEVVTLRALPPSEWEALVDLHPATEEQQAAGRQWNTVSFRPALLAACVVPAEGEDPLSEADWDVLAKDGALAPGELNTLFNAAVNINLRVPPAATGKD
jgi:hypothetical protein